MGVLLEAPVGLIDRSVELRFHAEDMSQVEIFFQNKSYGLATIVNAHVNSKIGRNWDSNPRKSREAEQLDLPTNTQTGQLFSNRIEKEV